MEIVTETVHNGDYFALIIFFSLCALLFVGLFIVGVAYSIIEKDFDGNQIAALLIVLTIGSMSVWALTDTVKANPDVEYKAIVEDFNEVYNNGYKITGRDGKLYILEKESND